MNLKYTVVFEREDDGRVIASVPGVPGCLVYGRTPASALKRVKRALEFYLEAVRLDGRRPPRQKGPVAVEITVAA